MGLGVKVAGLESWVHGLGFRIVGVWLSVKGLGYRVVSIRSLFFDLNSDFRVEVVFRLEALGFMGLVSGFENWG